MPAKRSLTIYNWTSVLKLGPLFMCRSSSNESGGTAEKPAKNGERSVTEQAEPRAEAEDVGMIR
jgi:hypothetical protein